jgi:formylglycine-generating enzyme required for sulfatase activity
LADCGALGENCCMSTELVGGSFYRSYDAASFMDKSFPATVSPFRLDKYEVTVARFRQFVGAVIAGWLPQPGSGKHVHINGGHGLTDSSATASYEAGWGSTWTANLATTQSAWNASLAGSTCTWKPTSGNDNLPINCLTWYELYAFCIWDGGFLPSEAEWNFAAAGGGASDGQRVYPWSSPPISSNIDSSFATFNNGPAGLPSAVGLDSPHGDGKWGQTDLAGNVSEWILDWYSDYVVPCTDCSYLAAGTGTPQRAVRGGGWYDSAFEITVSTRIYQPTDPTLRGDFRGGRCARAP